MDTFNECIILAVGGLEADLPEPKHDQPQAVTASTSLTLGDVSSIAPVDRDKSDPYNNMCIIA